ncbi:molecular chaperone HtpG [Ruminococcus sp. YE71]|uniref:HSP90 family protein n=1 Tax=unclassified Ruminococcus TaxID=2608920 RepID=UPI000888BD61|nr:MULTISPECIES: HSP90 family protein [unclassified Ruminococcus]SDA15663.1 molecular chaperone HtpG [Ruminococcus sp. YE78]SFW22953.1 molecular chaperone HtpG [Ruminococcus sp. YE71]
MSEHQFSVDLGGMISILSDHLYSSPDVFLRELLQNAADAIGMRKRSDKTFKDPEINVTADGKSIVFRDNGTGLTEEEVHKFVSVIGKSSKRGSGSFIGRFGIGLLSCFIVTDEIVLRSRSVKAPDCAVEWHGFADGRYSIRQIPPDMPIGSSISFSPSEGKESFFEAELCEERLRYFGLPLPYPIYVSADGITKTRANVLYIGEEGGRNERRFVLDTGKRIFGADTEFLDYIPLDSPSGLFSGAAYILPFTVSAAGSPKRHRIYLKSMLLTEDGTGLLPEWAFFVRCFINTDKLRPTASREGFYQDELLDKARQEIAECISGYLELLSVKDPTLLQRIGRLHGTALRSIACENEQLLRTFLPYFMFETSFGSVSGETLTDSRKDIFYISDIEVFRQLKPIFAEADRLLVNTAYVHEKDLLLFAERLGIMKVQQLSDNVLSDTLGECPNEEDFDGLVKIFDSALKKFDCRAVMRSFKPEQLSAIYSRSADADIKRDIQHSKENGDAVFGSMLGVFEEEYKDVTASLYLNCRSELIQRLSSVSDRVKLTTFAKILYVQALISGGYPVHAKEMNIMNENLIKLIEWGI